MKKSGLFFNLQYNIMQPFLILPRIIHNSDDQWIKVTGRLRPDEISDYYEGGVNQESTVVVLKSGSCFLLDMPITDFDDILLQYHRTRNGEVLQFLNILPRKK